MIANSWQCYEYLKRSALAQKWVCVREKSQKFNIKQKIVEDHSRISRFVFVVVLIRSHASSIHTLAISLRVCSAPFPTLAVCRQPKIFRRLNSNCFPLYTCSVLYANMNVCVVYVRIY